MTISNLIILIILIVVGIYLLIFAISRIRENKDHIAEGFLYFAYVPLMFMFGIISIIIGFYGLYAFGFISF